MKRKPVNLRTETGAIAMITSISRQTLQAFLLVVVAVTLGGCAITIQSPANNATIALPSTTSVVVTGNASFTNLRVMVDGTDFSSMMVSTGSSRAQGDFILPAGTHTITATATVTCTYCPGGSTQSIDTKSFVVAASGNPRVCAGSGGAPVITLDPNSLTAGQLPGRRQIAYRLQNGDGVTILVDDAPGLPRTSMLVEVDFDAFKGVGRSKMIEAWASCPQPGSPVSFVTSGILGGVACAPLTPANNFRSGCTNPDPPMLINQATTSELWLRKQGSLGNWDHIEGIDQSIWPVFGGRRLRFIWFFDR